MEEIEQMQSTEGASQESSPSTPESAVSETSSASSGAETQQQSQPQTEASTPFHEHPRWKELMSERDQYRQALSEMQAQLKALQPQAPKTRTAEEEMIEEVTKANPVFGSMLKNMYDKLSKVDNLETTWQAKEMQTLQTQTNSELKSLHMQHKVPETMHSLYQNEIRAIANSNPNLRASDLPAVYKQVHDRMTAFVEGIKRAEREAYANAKRADANVPVSQPKGSPTKASPKPMEFSSNKDEARQQIIAAAMRNIHASRNAG